MIGGDQRKPVESVDIRIEDGDRNTGFGGTIDGNNQFGGVDGRERDAVHFFGGGFVHDLFLSLEVGRSGRPGPDDLRVIFFRRVFRAAPRALPERFSCVFGHNDNAVFLSRQLGGALGGATFGRIAAGQRRPQNQQRQPQQLRTPLLFFR